MAPRLKSIVPIRVRRRLEELVGLDDVQRRVEALEAQLTRLETRLHESHEEAWQRSRVRWRGAKPDAHLTWGVEVSGDAFVEKADSYGAYGAGKAIVEVGPGYGRLLNSCLERGVEFGSYLGIDLSAENVQRLRERFPQESVHFVEGDAESVELDRPADSVLSSLTFKHLFPSFERALSNLGRQMRVGGLAVFDLIEGERRFFESDELTYIRWYTQPEVEEIVARASLELEAFDEVRHHPDVSRLLVVARKPG